jgi:hypothetical protein
MAKTVSVNTVDPGVPVESLVRDLRSGALGGALAAIGNLVLYVIAQALAGAELVVPTGPGGELVPLTPLNVALTSFIPGVVAGLILWLLTRATREPVQIFLGVAISFLLFSFTAPLGLPSIPDNTRVLLAAMHVIAAISILGVLLKYNR